MAQAKRYGLEVRDDLEVELRFRRIEEQLERLLPSDGTDGGGTKRLNTPPQVTGLRVVGSVPGAVTLAWNAVPISDLRRYELDIAEDIAFTVNKQSFPVAGTQHQFSTVSSEGGGGGTVIYARVRARNRAGVVGPWSATLNTSTGQAQTEDIGEGQVETENISNTTLEGITLVTSDGTHTFNPTTRLHFNPNHFYLAGDNSLGDDPIVNLNLGFRKTSSGLMDVPDASGGVSSFSHGQNGMPDIVHGFLVNVTAESNYVAGDRVPITSDAFGAIALGQPAYTLWYNATTAGVAVVDETGGGGGRGIYIQDRNGVGTVKLTRANWRILIDTYKIV
jgi:hypothetical protein